MADACVFDWFVANLQWLQLISATNAGRILGITRRYDFDIYYGDLHAGRITDECGIHDVIVRDDRRAMEDVHLGLHVDCYAERSREDCVGSRIWVEVTESAGSVLQKKLDPR